jgi:predicted AAA+ superfamily ATPase
VSESLAGRISFLELTPFLLPELHPDKLDALWLMGGYPNGGILGGNNYPQWQADYLTTLAERDLPAWGLPSKAVMTKRFFRMLAGTQGQTWNASMIANSLGVNHETISSYLEYLVGSFLIRRLQPYYANIRKRLAKTPKTYWRDTGLLHSLLNVRDEEALLGQPWAGASWEGFVIEQAIGVLTAHGKHFEPYFLRTVDQQEIDLILDFGTELWAVEIKLTSSPSHEEIECFNRTADLIKAKRRFFVSRTRECFSGGNFTLCGLDSFLRILL